MLDKVVMVFLVMFAAAPVPTGLGWQKDNTVTVHFVQDANTPETCGKAPEGYINLACVTDIGKSEMYVMNPCLFKDRDPYARTLCHELGHTHGWRHEYR